MKGGPADAFSTCRHCDKSIEHRGSIRYASGESIGADICQKTSSGDHAAGKATAKTATELDAEIAKATLRVGQRFDWIGRTFEIVKSARQESHRHARASLARSVRQRRAHRSLLVAGARPRTAALQGNPVKTAAQLQAEIDDELRAKEWQARTERDELARRERVAAMDARPSQEQRYNERAADRAAGIEHGEKRGRASEFSHAGAEPRAGHRAQARTGQRRMESRQRHRRRARDSPACA